MGGTIFIFLEEIETPKIIAIIKNIGIHLFVPIIFNEYDINGAILLLNFIKDKFIPDLTEVLMRDKNYFFDQHFTDLLDEKIDQDIEDLLIYSNAQDFVDEKEIETKKIKNQLTEFGLNLMPNFSKYGNYDWWKIGTQNYIGEQVQKDD